MTASLSASAFESLVDGLFPRAGSATEAKKSSADVPGRSRNVPEAGDHRDRPAPPRRNPVLSVSARGIALSSTRDLQAPAASEDVKPPEAPEAGPAFDVRRLQSLLEQAQRESTRLQQFIRSGAACETEMINTVARLDERLSVGAQMLGAFQHQIERIEDAVQTALALEQRNRALYEAIAELLDSHTTGSPRDGGQQCEGDAASIHPSL